MNFESPSNMMTERPSFVEPEMKGWLWKWTNYLKGYQRRWFVLSNGLLSYYRNQAEMAHTCRGTISLHGALIHTEDSCTFVISNGGSQTFHIKALNEVERQRWVTALELAKAKAIQEIENEPFQILEECELMTMDNVKDIGKNEVAYVIKTLSKKLEELEACNDSVIKHKNSLQKSLSELESLDSAPDITTKIKEINERATLFRISSNSVIKKCSEYLEVAQNHGRKWQRMLQNEREKRIQLEEMVEQLAREQNALEVASKPSEGGDISDKHQDIVSSEDDLEFYDAQSGDTNETKFMGNSRRHGNSNSLSDTQVFDKIVSEELAADDGSSSGADDQMESAAILTATIRSTATMKNKKSRHNDGKDRRKSHEVPARSEALPLLSDKAKSLLEETKKHPLKKGAERRAHIPDKPHHPLHIWSIMKNCIGKDLSKIPMPVNFSEPLSMLQRLTEDFEYADILDEAAKCSDPFEKLAYIAAFSITSYSTTATRTGKPFNPLLGETFECDRTEDLGWRSCSEQVSHHPPIAALHFEGKRWTCWQQFTMTSKFRGKYLQVTPSGMTYLMFSDSDDYYTWNKVTTTVHNIIVGKLWVDQEGEMEIRNHKDGSKCRLTYIPYSYFARDQQRKVKGVVTDGHGEAKWVVTGVWDNKVDIAPVAKVDKENGTWQTGSSSTVWQRNPPLPGSENFYNFTALACQLNEMEEGVAPTDSRLRPDQRLMELGLWDEANIEKLRLEEKQRQRRKEKSVAYEEGSVENGDYNGTTEALWFTRELDKYTKDVSYKFTGEYWKCKEKGDWSGCPDIF